MSIVDRFRRYVNRGPKCWEWTGALNGVGYGQFWMDGRNVSAHRAAFLLFNGVIPPSLNVCHKCDNRKCVRPSHLFVGTQSDNIKDCVRKGRYTSPQKRGEQASRALLTEIQVIEIKALLRCKLEQRIIAEMYGVKRSVVGHISCGKSWSHVNC